MPDVVLIDGRFRVACFLTSLLKSKVGAVIIFDDYSDRNHYHVVEEFVEVSHLEQRQAIFVVPELSDDERLSISELLNDFRMVRE